MLPRLLCILVEALGRLEGGGEGIRRSRDSALGARFRV